MLAFAACSPIASSIVASFEAPRETACVTKMRSLYSVEFQATMRHVQISSVRSFALNVLL